jgi:hypothetical protein
MKYSVRWSITAACAFLLSHALAIRPAFADLLSGTYTIPPAGDSKIIPLTGGTFDTNTITRGCSPEDLLIDVTEYFTANPFVAIGLNDGMLTPQFKINCPNVGEATFAFVAPPPNGTANVDFNNFPAPGGEFSAELNLLDDPTGMFGAFADALFVISYFGLVLDPTGDGRAHWPVPAGGTTSIRFQINSIPRAPVIPEPASLSLAVCGLAGLTGLAWLRRRQRKSLELGN